MGSQKSVIMGTGTCEWFLREDVSVKKVFEVFDKIKSWRGGDFGLGVVCGGVSFGKYCVVSIHFIFEKGVDISVVGRRLEKLSEKLFDDFLLIKQFEVKIVSLNERILFFSSIIYK